MRPHVETIMAYLHVADKVLEWHAQQRTEQQPPQLTTWITHHPFLKAALGAGSKRRMSLMRKLRSSSCLKKRDQTLVAMQVKNKPI